MTGERLALARGRTWIAGRGLGLVPIRPTLNWAGPWLACARRQRAGPLAPARAGLGDLLEDESFESILRRYLVGPTDHALGQPFRRPTPPRHGRVRPCLARAAERPCRAHEARARGRGSRAIVLRRRRDVSNPASSGTTQSDEAEQLEGSFADRAHSQRRYARRNIITRGIDSMLCGRNFRVGAVELRAGGCASRAPTSRA